MALLRQNLPAGKPLCPKCGDSGERKRFSRVHSDMRYARLPDGSNTIKSFCDCPIGQRALAEHDARAAAKP
jgi:hypothetical protein